MDLSHLMKELVADPADPFSALLNCGRMLDIMFQWLEVLGRLHADLVGGTCCRG